MPGQMRREVTLHPDRPHAWPTNTVWNAERFVEVNVANIGAKISGPRQTYKRIANTIAAPYVNINTQNGNLFGCQSPISEMVRDHRWRWTVAHLHQFRAGARFLAWYANGEPYPAIVTLDEATSHNQEPEQPFLLVILRGLANMTFGWQYGRFVHVA